MRCRRLCCKRHSLSSRPRWLGPPLPILSRVWVLLYGDLKRPRGFISLFTSKKMVLPLTAGTASAHPSAAWLPWLATGSPQPSTWPGSVRSSDCGLRHSPVLSGTAAWASCRGFGCSASTRCLSILHSFRSRSWNRWPPRAR